MAYSELIKNFQLIRNYMRQFFVYGFRSRLEYDAGSARSYDDVRRRIDSWLGEYMSFHQSESGKARFLSVDSRNVAHNPLYQAFKAKSFTDHDIVLHFFLLDLLAGEDWLSFREITKRLYAEYLQPLETELYPDDSTVRGKLREYVQLGLLEQRKEGRNYLYRCSRDTVNPVSWRDAAAFFSETAPAGVIGSFLLDKDSFRPEEDLFRFKHHYILHALDSEILSEILAARQEHLTISLRVKARKREGASAPAGESVRTVYPLRLYISTQTGREYLLAYVYRSARMSFFRLDNISAVRPGKPETNREDIEAAYRRLKDHLWGVSLGPGRQLDHVELTIHAGAGEDFIVNRLEREKRNGTVEQVAAESWRYVTDTHEAAEMLPWVRTFIGRIEAFSCSDPLVERQFREDLAETERMYGLTPALSGTDGSREES